jgi:hypothetical protein
VLYLVQFSFKTERANSYRSLAMFLRTKGAMKLLSNTYDIRSEESAQNVFADVADHLNLDDPLLVAELTMNTKIDNVRILSEEFMKLLRAHTQE